MSRSVTLVGLDVGSTTCCAVVAQAQVTHGGAGRVELTDLAEVYRSPLEFTPFVGSSIDEHRMAEHLDTWLKDAGVRESEIFGGGALITGLAAARSNAQAVTRLVEARLAQALIATADAPRFESWLAFMGNCHKLSINQPDLRVLNLDIGGGTTNLALGRAGQVYATSSLHVGARHVEFELGSYRLRRTSSLGKQLLKQRGIHRSIGESLSDQEVRSLVDYYVGLLIAAIDNQQQPRSPLDPLDRLHVQTDWTNADSLDTSCDVLTLSGGVGQLVYQARENPADLPFDAKRPAPFGDLGWELALAICATPVLANRLTVSPDGLGRATVFGLLRHSTELSGSTIHLPHPDRLPLSNVPILGRVPASASSDQILQRLHPAIDEPAMALQVDLTEPDLKAVQQLGRTLCNEILPAVVDQTLILLVPANVGKTLGQYATHWGSLQVDLIVIDEVPVGDFQFVRLGHPRDNVVPLWFYSAR